jgi:cell division initiation protein
MIKPLEIQNHTFRKAWKGFDQDEVRQFLFAVAEDFAGLLENNHKMAHELSALKDRLHDMESRDKILKDTLVSAQQIKAEIQENAHKEAELLLKEAQMQADSIYEEAREQVEHVRRQLTDLQRIRGDMLAEAEIMVSRFNHFIEAERAAAEETNKLRTLQTRKKQRPKVQQIQEEKEPPARRNVKQIQ